MKLRVRLDAGAPRRWHRALLDRLAARPGVTVEVEAASGPPLPAGASLLFSLERLLHGLPPGGPAAAAAPADFAAFPRADGPADLVLDLCGGAPAGATPTWTVAYDGMAGELGLLAALAAGRAPVVTVHDGTRLVAQGRPGTEHGGILLPAFEDTLTRTTSLILAAFAGGAFHAPADLPSPLHPAPTPSPTVLGKRAAREVAATLVRRLYRLCYHSPHWRVGWRRVDGPDVIDLEAHPAGGWRNLGDDGRRFYADPFPIERNGVVTLFVEDFAHRLGKGIISAVAFGPDGPLGVPEPVLELDCHLSYPFVFERDGETWMIPETSGAGTVELYRATRFPGGWVKEATLLSGLVAGDATLVEHGGRWWMFATVQDGGGAFSDALYLWSAPDFRGPWTPHAHNPVLIDIASARPAGRMVRRNGTLWRPVQDCRAGYGAALGLARVLRLDDDGFEQEVAATLRAGPLWPGRRLHTLNRAGPIEVIDGSARARFGR